MLNANELRIGNWYFHWLFYSSLKQIIVMDLQNEIVKAISSSTYNSKIVKNQLSQEVIDARIAAGKCTAITKKKMGEFAEWLGNDCELIAANEWKYYNGNKWVRQTTE